MADLSKVKKGALVIGADGVKVGTVDHVQDGRIQLTNMDSTDSKHHYIDGGLLAEVEDGTVRLSANADVAVTMETTDGT